MAHAVRRRTKIIATLGPACDTDDKLQTLFEKGVDLVRLNFSHGTVDSHIVRVHQVRKVSEKIGKKVGIIADLQGPKIRIQGFKQASVDLVLGQTFTLDLRLDKHAGTASAVGLDFPPLIHQVYPGDELWLEDGKIRLQVKKLEDHAVICTVVQAGTLGSFKGLNRKGGGLAAPAFTSKDQKDLAAIATVGVDYIALSFVGSAQDVIDLRKALEQLQCTAKIISKIERRESIALLRSIVEVSDAVMVARGDLGVELGFANLPGAQKRIIQMARKHDKAAIVATQMMESMITQPIPTRAEVSDVANAVLDGTDAVMLSAESATGAYPSETVAALHDICLAAESSIVADGGIPAKARCQRWDEAIALATMFTAHHVNIQAILALTESGATPLWMSRVDSHIPIFGLSPHDHTCGRMTLYRGVYPMEFAINMHTAFEVVREAIRFLVKQGALKMQDKVIVTKGDILGTFGGTNGMKIVTVTQQEHGV